MGQVQQLKCKKCGHIWEHWAGVGFQGKPLKGDKKGNKTGDADGKIRCPKCGSEEHEVFAFSGLWD